MYFRLFFFLRALTYRTFSRSPFGSIKNNWLNDRFDERFDERFDTGLDHVELITRLWFPLDMFVVELDMIVIELEFIRVVDYLVDIVVCCEWLIRSLSIISVSTGCASNSNDPGTVSLSTSETDVFSTLTELAGSLAHG